MDARFNRAGLAERVTRIANVAEKIAVHRLDALSFLHFIAPLNGRNTFMFLDPPYYRKGSMLYMNFYQHDDHAALASYLKKECKLRWIMTYDDAQEIRKLYAWCALEEFSLNYFSFKANKGRELLIRPKHVVKPDGGVAPVYNIRVTPSGGAVAPTLGAIPPIVS